MQITDISQGPFGFDFLHLSGGSLKWLFFIAMALFLLVSAILQYHWMTYNRRNGPLYLAQILYWSVSAVLVMSAFIGITTY